MAYSPSLNDFDSIDGSQSQGYVPSTSDFDNFDQAPAQNILPLSNSPYLSGFLGRNVGSMATPQQSQIAQQMGPPVAEGMLGAGLGMATEGALSPALSSLGIGDSFMGGALLNRVLSGAAGGAVGALPTSLTGQPSNILSNEALGTALGGGLSGIMGAFQPGSLAKYLGGQATPDQVAAIQAAQPEGVKLPVGNVINSPWLQKAYSALGMVPFSGTGKPWGQMNNFFSNTLSDLSGSTGLDSSQDLDGLAYSDMKSNYEAAKSNTESLYNQFSQAAENISPNSAQTPNTGTPSLGKSLGVPQSGQMNFDTSAYDDAINQAISGVKSNIPLKDDGTPNQVLQNMYKPVLNFLNEYKNTPINNFSTAMSLDKGITDLMGSMADDPVALRYLKMVKGNDPQNPTGLAQSMDDTAAQYPSISGLYQQAKQARVDQGNFEQFNNKPTQFFRTYQTQQKAPLNFSNNNFINKSLPTINSTSNNPDSISAFMNNLSPDGQNAVRANFMTPPANQSDNSISAQISRIQNLSQPEQQAMFGEKAPLVSQMQTIANTYPKGKSPGFFEPTGFSGAKMLALLMTPKAWPIIPLGAASRMALSSDWLPNAYVNSLNNAASPSGASSLLGPLARQGIIQSSLAGANQ